MVKPRRWRSKYYIPTLFTIFNSLSGPFYTHIVNLVVNTPELIHLAFLLGHHCPRMCSCWACICAYQRESPRRSMRCKYQQKLLLSSSLTSLLQKKLIGVILKREFRCGHFWGTYSWLTTILVFDNIFFALPTVINQCSCIGCALFWVNFYRFLL